MSSSNCPKCQGPRDAKALYCPFCGTVFARYVAAAESAPAVPQPAPFAPASGPEAASPPSPFLSPPPVPTSEAPRSAGTVYGGDLAPGTEAGWNPYQGPRYEPTYNAKATRDDFELATRGSRLAAQMLNGFALMGVMLVCIVPIAALAGASQKGDAAGAVMAIVGALIASGLWVYFNLRQLSATGQSLGKKWMGVRIVTTQGDQPSLSQLVFRRYLAMQALGIIPVIGPILGLVNILMIFGAEQRCLHDHFADTLVVKA